MNAKAKSNPSKIKYYSAARFLVYGLRKKFAICNFVFVLLWTFINSFHDQYLSSLSSEMVNKDISVLKHKILIYLLLVIAWAVEEYVLDLFIEINAEDLEVSTRKYFFSLMYKCKPNILRDNNTGYVAGLVDKLTHKRCELVSLLITDIPMTIVYISYISVVFAVKYSYIYSIIILSLCIAATIFRILGNKFIKPYVDSLSEAEAENTQLFLDTGININTVQKLQAVGFILDKFKVSIKKCREVLIRWATRNEIAFCGFKLITYMIFPICAYVQVTHPETVGNVIEFYVFLALVQLRMVHTIRSVYRFLWNYTKYKSPFDKLSSILNEQNVRSSYSTEAFEMAEIKDCDYSYEYINPENKEAVKTVRVQIPYFKITRGDIVCVHGESGQGKTTLLNILSGEIETDNVYINQKPSKDRLDCVFIAQDTEIFDMTIHDNLSLGNEDITDEEIYDMLSRAGLKEWIDKQPEKLNTRLGERGVFVSTGQRQRLNLIRGLIIPFGEIYLLDEPTSNVDNETEIQMINLIKEKLQGKTAIIVTHKPRIKEICNKSYLFENGVLYSENQTTP